jgi:hypothetical protein
MADNRQFPSARPPGVITKIDLFPACISNFSKHLVEDCKTAAPDWQANSVQRKRGGRSLRFRKGARMLRPVSSLRPRASPSALVPCKNIRAKTSAAFSSQGIGTPAPVQERLRTPCCTLSKRKRRKASEMADALANVLIERNSVLEPRAARMRRRRQNAIVRRMTAINIRMTNATENSEIVAMLFA